MGAVAVERTKVRVTAPVELPVKMEEARSVLRARGTEYDLDITLWLEGMVPSVEHDIGQCLVEQMWEVRQNVWTCRVPLPHPVIAVEQLSYIDAAGAQKTLGPSDYVLVRNRYESYLVAPFGCSWPEVRGGPASVLVRVRSGYGSSAAAVPRNVQLYLLARLRQEFDPATQPDASASSSPYLERLLDNCRSG